MNGNRAAVIDWAATDPEGWEADKSPELKSFSDIIIYEMHHRDFSIAANSGVTHKGKFLALAGGGHERAGRRGYRRGSSEGVGRYPCPYPSFL